MNLVPSRLKAKADQVEVSMAMLGAGAIVWAERHSIHFSSEMGVVRAIYQAMEAQRRLEEAGDE